MDTQGGSAGFQPLLGGYPFHGTSMCPCILEHLRRSCFYMKVNIWSKPKLLFSAFLMCLGPKDGEGEADETARESYRCFTRFVPTP